MSFKNRINGETVNQGIVYDLAAALGALPVRVDESYYRSCLRASEVLRVTPDVRLTELSDQALKNATFAMRNAVLKFTSSANDRVISARATGQSVPPNPFFVITSLAADDDFTVAPAQADELVGLVNRYVDLLTGQTSDLTSVVPLTQISSARLALDGFGSKGNVAVELMKFLPSLDQVTQKKADDVLAALDFKKRVPKVVFTAEYAPDGQFRGVLVGWRKIADATGYIVKRHDIFKNTDATFRVSNEQLRSIFSQVGDYVQTWVLSFYAGLNPSSVCVFIDGTTEPDSYYTYKVQAYQTQNLDLMSLFGVDTVPGNLSAAQRSAVVQQITDAVGQELLGVVSPYPYIARQIYGDDRLDWILAGVNFRASLNRNDQRADSRSLAYVGSTVSSVFALMDQGKFVMPKEMNAIPSRLTNSIVHFGVGQTVSQVMQETGILLALEGIDPQGPQDIFAQGAVDVSKSSLLSGIVSAIDPENVTVDLRNFATNFPHITVGSNIQQNSARDTRVEAQTREVAVSPDSFSTVPSGVVDVMTFDGLSAFVRTIRILTDLGRDRSGEVFVPDPTPPIANGGISGTKGSRTRGGR